MVLKFFCFYDCIVSSFKNMRSSSKIKLHLLKTRIFFQNLRKFSGGFCIMRILKDTFLNRLWVIFYFERIFLKHVAQYGSTYLQEKSVDQMCTCASCRLKSPSAPIISNRPRCEHSHLFSFCYLHIHIYNLQNPLLVVI